jgi:hypothetical protein
MLCGEPGIVPSHCNGVGRPIEARPSSSRCSPESDSAFSSIEVGKFITQKNDYFLFRSLHRTFTLPLLLILQLTDLGAVATIAYSAGLIYWLAISLSQTVRRRHGYRN